MFIGPKICQSSLLCQEAVIRRPLRGGSPGNLERGAPGVASMQPDPRVVGRGQSRAGFPEPALRGSWGRHGANRELAKPEERRFSRMEAGR